MLPEALSTAQPYQGHAHRLHEVLAKYLLETAVRYGHPEAFQS